VLIKSQVCLTLFAAAGMYSSNLKVGSEHEVFVSNVDNGPFCFMVHLKNDFDTLQALMMQMETYRAQFKPLQVNLTLTPKILSKS
jgi:hypothetical protein